ncbi:hypothetical protein BASA82_000938 [Batrachochytrium salamandrivorans]|uniref:Biogenesis of lysosome-related organelles complex 1 subunit KXD1 n=1 Tax=Batrachochytrium salamandrivorans TaxID=1357716 RepID=A0ABQ8F1H8_9FUNG|nr:hypothetical protein BASA62_008729 [Batrachochytrium salamandrivorans]KAH6588799.1 hypothetical protein BASA50_010505 [Batrachochytrium salamandrivorans]KAH9257192.1 hypothetical protein BASA81_004581 [Batrachochytrium salamandrivorans]KAH9262021.1 hypothetical protein BASA82_000938 [Batrachochytrium salamandrivorans]
MKLAIASTTILFAMMAAQAAVLSVAPATDVSLVKRAPNGGDDVGQSDMPGQSSSDQAPQIPFTEIEQAKMQGLYIYVRGRVANLKRSINTKQVEISRCKVFISRLEQECERKTSYACRNSNANIAKLKKELIELEEQLEAIMKKYQKYKPVLRDLVEATHKYTYNYLREKYLKPQ